jgi:hypothetical protein
LPYLARVNKKVKKAKSNSNSKLKSKIRQIKDFKKLISRH